MFLIDKYKINNIEDVIFNKNIYLNLINIKTKKKNYIINNLSEYIYNKNKKKVNLYKNIPNILIYGLEGTGKKSLINCLIKKIYNLDEIILKKSIYKINGYGNNSVDVEIYHSPYHIIIEPFNTGFDKYLIQGVIKEYIKNKLISLDGSNYYKIIFINKIDTLSYYAQTSLRCTMEKYSNYCKFILCGKNISKIIDPIKSRCLFIKIPRPTYNDIINLILTINYKEKKIISKDQLYNLVKNYNRNIKQIIWNLNLIYFNTSDNNIVNNSIDYIYNLIINVDDIIKNIKLIRDRLYLLFISNIDFTLLLNKLLLKLNSNIYDNKSYEINKIISDADFNIATGKRVVIHFENAINNLIYILNK